MGACHVKTMFHRMIARSVRGIGDLPLSLSSVAAMLVTLPCMLQIIDILSRRGRELADDFMVLKMNASVEESRIAKRDRIREQYQEAGPSYLTRRLVMV